MKARYLIQRDTMKLKLSTPIDSPLEFLTTKGLSVTSGNSVLPKTESSIQYMTLC